MGRGLVVLCKLYELERREELPDLIKRYLAFLWHAQTPRGSFHNFLGYDRRFLDEEGSEDTLGRVVWGLGHAVRADVDPGVQALARTMIHRAYEAMELLTYPRGMAYALLGLAALLDRDREDRRLHDLLARLAHGLADRYERIAAPDWSWFENEVTYGNAKLSEALLAAYRITGESRFREIGLGSLGFLTEHQWRENRFEIVGNKGWWRRGAAAARFDEQPIDAGYLAEAHAAAFGLTRDPLHLERAQAALEWFLGRNRLGLALYDFSTGAVADGLTRDGINPNTGAESVLAFLLALLALSQVRSRKKGSAVSPDGLECTTPWNGGHDQAQADRSDLQLSAPALRHRDLH